MKTEFTDVSETQKTVTIEIDSAVVEAEIDRVAQGFKKVQASPASVRARSRQRSSSAGFATRFFTR